VPLFKPNSLYISYKGKRETTIKSYFSMKALKFILIAIGVIAIIMSIVFMVIGWKVVSAVVGYLIGGIAILAAIGFIIYFIGKSSGRNSD